MRCDFSPDFSSDLTFDFSSDFAPETLPGWEVFFVGVPNTLPSWVVGVRLLEWEVWGDRLFLEEGFLFRAWVLEPDDDWEFGVGDRLLEAGFWGLLLPPGVE
ncbi:MAG: hypothetical protein AAGF75_06890 [Cyanobacteria bacterium P01_H01_bin.130]